MDGDGYDDALLSSSELADGTAWLRGGSGVLEPTLLAFNAPGRVTEGLGDSDLDGDIDCLIAS